MRAKVTVAKINTQKKTNYAQKKALQKCAAGTFVCLLMECDGALSVAH